MQASDIEQLLGSVSTTFATVEYVSNVKTAAKYKAHRVTKHVTANVTLFARIIDKDVYARAVVKRSTTTVTDFKTNETYYEHDLNCFSIVRHKKTEKEYLYCFYNSVLSSEYTVDDKPSDKLAVLEMLTPSARKQIEQSLTTNKTNDVEHGLTVRTIALDNIKKIRANKQELIG